MKEAGFKDIQIYWLSLSTQQGTKIQSTLEGTETEKKQSQNYVGRFARPDITEPENTDSIFIGIKVKSSVLVMFYIKKLEKTHRGFRTCFIKF